MSESQSQQAGDADDAAEQPAEANAPGADELEDSVQRGGTHSAPPMELDSVQGSGMADDENTIALKRERE